MEGPNIDQSNIIQSIVQEVKKEIIPNSEIEHQIASKNESEYEELITDILPPEELRAQQVFERNPPIPLNASTKIKSVLLPKLYQLFETLAIPFTGTFIKILTILITLIRENEICSWYLLFNSSRIRKSMCK